MASELRWLVANEMFSEATPPKGREPVGSKWNFQWKTRSFREMVRL